jgi:hypothetical protein
VFIRTYWGSDDLQEQLHRVRASVIVR